MGELGLVFPSGRDGESSGLSGRDFLTDNNGQTFPEEVSCDPRLGSKLGKIEKGPFLGKGKLEVYSGNVLLVTSQKISILPYHYELNAGAQGIELSSDDELVLDIFDISGTIGTIIRAFGFDKPEGRLEIFWQELKAISPSKEKWEEYFRQSPERIQNEKSTSENPALSDLPWDHQSISLEELLEAIPVELLSRFNTNQGEDVYPLETLHTIAFTHLQKVSDFVSICNELIDQWENLSTEDNQNNFSDNYSDTLSIVKQIMHDVNNKVSYYVPRVSLIEKIRKKGSSRHAQLAALHHVLVYTAMPNINERICELAVISLGGGLLDNLDEEAYAALDLSGIISSITGSIPEHGRVSYKTARVQEISEKINDRYNLTFQKEGIGAEILGRLGQNLETIMSNLLSNANKYSAEGTQILIDFGLEESSHDAKVDLVMSVTNFGPGIDSETLSIINNPEAVFTSISFADAVEEAQINMHDFSSLTGINLIKSVLNKMQGAQMHAKVEEITGGAGETREIGEAGIFANRNNVAEQAHKKIVFEIKIPLFVA